MIKRKILASAILVVLVLSTGITGCSNEAVKKDIIEVTSTSKVEDKNSDDNKKSTGHEKSGVEKRYDDFLNSEDMKGRKLSEVNAKIKENAAIIMDLNKKANAYSGSCFYVETAITAKGLTRNGSFLRKEYFQEGNYRCEEYDGKNKLQYLTVYNKDEDTNYSYEADKDLLRKTTEFSQKGKLYSSYGSEIYGYGFFVLESNNAWNGDFKTVDYNGKQVICSELTKANSTFKYWYDKQTGIMFKSEQKQVNNGKVENLYTEEFTVKPNEKFNISVFQYDPNNKSVSIP